MPATLQSERLSPRIHSPGQSTASFEGLTEAEIAILMDHDPDLNKDGEISGAGTALATSTPPPSTVADQEDRSPKEETKKKKRLKKGYVMAQRTVETIDDSIDNVIRLSVEYEDRIQAAKVVHSCEVTPSPWQLDPKPTKFPTKKQEYDVSDWAKHGNKELMTLMKTGQAAVSGINVPDNMQMFGQMTPVFGIPGMAPAGMTGVPTTYSHMMEGRAPYLPKEVIAEGDQTTKKKRSRRGSKDVGPDGKKKRRRKPATQTQSFPPGSQTEVVGMPGTMLMQAVGQPVMGGKLGTMGPMVPFPGGIMTSGAITAVGPMGAVPSASVEINKPTWKPLKLLLLKEPEIRRTHHMCVPKGTGLTECHNLLGGSIGEATYNGIPDLYEILFDLEKPPVSTHQPPTPPASLPPSPTHKQYQQTTSVGATTATTQSDAGGQGFSTAHGDKYGPLGLMPSGEMDPSHILHRQTPQVKVPESLPTPPHQGMDDKDENTALRLSDTTTMPPSSPEMDDEDEWAMFALATLRPDQINAKDRTVPLYRADEYARDSVSPPIQSTMCPKISVPPDFGRKRGHLNDKDSVSVTIEFDNANIKSIEKSLTLLSRILDTSIISYSMPEMMKSDKKIKDAINQAIKEEETKVSSQIIQNPPKKPSSEADGSPRPRRCLNCNTVVNGNGVRRPRFDQTSYEEDVIFCNKDCYLKIELLDKKMSPAPVKKKFKASHVYQRHTCKINMSSLLEKYPDDEPLTPSKSRMGLELSDVPLAVQEAQRAVAGERGRGRGRRRGLGSVDDSKVAGKKWRGLRWKKWSVTVTMVKANAKPPVDVDALLNKYGAALKPPPDLIDRRTCVFCNVRGDGDTHTIARLLNVDVDRWVHLNCALWSAEVYETQGGALINVEQALRRSESVLCCLCQKKGATIHCHRPRCVNTYHCQCALDIKCVFFKDKTVLCPTHAPKPGTAIPTGFASHQHHHSGDTLRSLAVFRKVYVQRPETKQIASVMQQGELAQGERNYMLRVGALIFENVGQLATHQMAMCHSKTAIYPIGYKATRIYWSSCNMRRRCKYECTVNEVVGKPCFRMAYKAALPGKNKPERTKTHADDSTRLEGDVVNDLWMQILKPLEKLRSQHNVLKLFPKYISGEKLFGLTASVVARILESLPNIELCSEYRFRYGRTPLLEVPLAINPTGCARSEPHIKQHRKKPHTLISNLISEYYESSGIGDASSLYGKQFVHSKSSQYRKMKQEWRTNVYLARSRIQGLGLFTARDIEPGTMVIEYIGDIIRIEVSEKREKMYEAANRGVYMFRLDSDHIVDATVTGGPARYINHSCNPNCVAEVVNFEKEKKIMIVSNRHLLKGEELSYDYKFDFEDEGRKIPCLCGASNCKKWMN